MRILPYLGLGLALSIPIPTHASDENLESEVKACQDKYDLILEPDSLFECMYEARGNQGAVEFYRAVIQSRVTHGFESVIGMLQSKTHDDCEKYKEEYLASFSVLALRALLHTEDQLEGAVMDLISFAEYQTAKTEAREEFQKRAKRLQQFHCN
ncbi:MAG: hypothetical protein QT02_C0003G0003 [archaeon GW2011_AR9]|nr:MAG: hypothetical protein QT02_C0003G0003 [archaeon GW2011_AR9]MBS3120924.1 hypothetical protein [Candidatus Woesearchaeota archaeon]HIH12454.1 hypothetical protein [Candidatus Woesearchaeota archaeon]